MSIPTQLQVRTGRPLPWRADFFADAGAACLADPAADLAGPCPSGCREALQEVKVQLGCCYQDIYNNSLTLNSLYILAPDERDFFYTLGTRELHVGEL